MYCRRLIRQLFYFPIDNTAKTSSNIVLLTSRIDYHGWLLIFRTGNIIITDRTSLTRRAEVRVQSSVIRPTRVPKYCRRQRIKLIHKIQYNILHLENAYFGWLKRDFFNRFYNMICFCFRSTVCRNFKWVFKQNGHYKLLFRTTSVLGICSGVRP